MNQIQVVDEKTYRLKLIREAKHLGCEIELRIIFKKYDDLLRFCTNPQEREQIGMLGVLEISELLDNKRVGKDGSLIVNNKVILSE